MEAVENKTRQRDDVLTPMAEGIAKNALESLTRNARRLEAIAALARPRDDEDEDAELRGAVLTLVEDIREGLEALIDQFENIGSMGIAHVHQQRDDFERLAAMVPDGFDRASVVVNAAIVLLGVLDEAPQRAALEYCARHAADLESPGFRAGFHSSMRGIVELGILRTMPAAEVREAVRQGVVYADILLESVAALRRSARRSEAQNKAARQKGRKR